MRKTGFIFGFILFLFWGGRAGLLHAQKTDSVPKVTIAGYTGLLPLLGLWVTNYGQRNKKAVFSLNGGGTTVGIAWLTDKRAQIAVKGRTLRAEEKNKEKLSGAVWTRVLVAKDAVAVVIHPDMEIENLSVSQLKSVLTGEIRNWKQLGGPDAKITVVIRDHLADNWELIKNRLLGEEENRKDAVVCLSDKAVIAQVSSTPYSLGYVSSPAVTPEVRVLSLDNVPLRSITIRDGSYPLSREIYFITGEEAGEEVKHFIRFTVSNQGQKIAEENGYGTIFPFKRGEERLWKYFFSDSPVK